MRVTEVICENVSDLYATNIPLSQYRGAMDTQTPDSKDLTILWSIVDRQLNAGKMPPVVTVPVNKLLATQTWLSNWGSDGDTWEELDQHPVVVRLDSQLLIVDGHHRVSRAIKAGRQTIDVYLVKANQHESN
jgi:hypothetical protein